MPLFKSVLNQFPGSLVGQAASARRIEEFNRRHVFAEHYCQVQPVGESSIADLTLPENDHSRLAYKLHGSTSQSSNGKALVVVCAI